MTYKAKFKLDINILVQSPLMYLNRWLTKWGNFQKIEYSQASDQPYFKALPAVWLAGVECVSPN